MVGGHRGELEAQTFQPTFDAFERLVDAHPESSLKVWLSAPA
jgi:hypothetical protein